MSSLRESRLPPFFPLSPGENPFTGADVFLGLFEVPPFGVPPHGVPASAGGVHARSSVEDIFLETSAANSFVAPFSEISD